MDYSMPAAWGPDKRDFWTQRKRSASSLFMVIILMTGIAVAFKLFQVSVPNNVVRDASTFDYEIWKRDANRSETNFSNTAGCPSVGGDCTSVYAAVPVFASGVSQYPGDTRDVEVRLHNTNLVARDATFQLYINNIGVQGCVDGSGTPQSCESLTPTSIAPSTNAYNAFVNFWTFSVDKELYAKAAGEDANEDDHNILDGDGNINEDPDNTTFKRYGGACGPAGLQALTSVDPCLIGNVKARGSFDSLNGRTDRRYFIFSLTEVDDGTNQSSFKGWTLSFDLVFQARVPALPDPTGPVSES